MRILLLALACVLAVTTARAAAAAPPQPGCKSAAARQFDFWLGNWKVYDYQTGKELQGTNNVTSEFDGCVLQEHWKATDGSTGSSFNIYDHTRSVWHQTWVDTFGQLLLLEGGMDHGSMVLQGVGRAASGKKFYHRITWTPMKNGSVRQHWQRSFDKKSWKDVFDGIYIKAE